MAADKEFPDGLMAKEKHPNAPEFVVCGLSIKRKDLGNWLRSKDDDWINLQVLRSRKGTLYVAVDNWKQDKSKPSSDNYSDDDDIPF
jgi:hypothetical protein